MQHALAREHGFDNWLAFKDAIDTRRPVAPTRPHRPATSVVEWFLRYACWEHHTHGASDYESQRAARCGF